MAINTFSNSRAEMKSVARKERGGKGRRWSSHMMPIFRSISISATLPHNWWATARWHFTHVVPVCVCGSVCVRNLYVFSISTHNSHCLAQSSFVFCLRFWYLTFLLVSTCAFPISHLVRHSCLYWCCCCCCYWYCMFTFRLNISKKSI